MPRGGSQAISDALASYLRELGGAIHTGTEVKRLDELPPARAYIFDTSPTALARIAGLGSAYRGYRYGAACLQDRLRPVGPRPLDREGGHGGPAPSMSVPRPVRSTARCAPRVAGRDPSVPFLITAQPSLIDPSRAPEGRHVFWAYGHVPAGWEGDATEVVERQLERFAPGFRDLVLARAIAGPPQLAARNANYVGGDIACGAFAGLQTVIRPKLARVAVRDRAPGGLPLLLGDPARARGARHVRSPRGEGGLATAPGGLTHRSSPVTA